MPQQPPDWWSRQRGPRVGCADVTIISIASIAAFIILIFVLLRPDFARVVDITGSGNITVGAARQTETIAPSTGLTSATSVPVTTRAVAVATVATPVPPTFTPVPPTLTPIPPTPTPSPIPTPAFRQASIKTECRLRQDASFDARILQIFRAGQTFRVYSDQRASGGETWWRVEPEDSTNRLGWMVSSCF